MRIFPLHMMALLLAFVRSPLAFAETPVANADVAIIARSLDATPNAELREIISFAASLRLDRNGLSSVVIAEPPKATENPGKTLARPESRGANCILLIESSENAKMLSLRFAWYDRASDKPIVELQRSGPEDMQMDELIFDAIGDLLDRVAAMTPIKPKAKAVAVAPRAAAETPNATAETPRAAAEASNATAETPRAAAEASNTTAETPKATAETSNATADSSIAAPDTPKAVASSPPLRGFALGFGAGPFLAGAALGSYFQAAGGLAGRATWYFPAGNFAIGLGISIEGTFFQAVGPLESVTGVMAPLAVDFQIVAPAARGLLLPYIHADVGAALMSLQTPIYGSRSTILPYAGAGIGLGWVLGSAYRISLEFSYRLFLDGSDLLSGFDPQLGVDIPLGKRK